MFDIQFFNNIFNRLQTYIFFLNFEDILKKIFRISNKTLTLCFKFKLNGRKFEQYQYKANA